MSETKTEDDSRFRCMLCDYTATSKSEIGDHFLSDHMEAYVSPVKDGGKADTTTDAGEGSQNEEKDVKDEAAGDGERAKVDTTKKAPEKKEAQRPRGRPPGRPPKKRVEKPVSLKPIKKQPRYYMEEIEVKEEVKEEPEELGRGMRRRKKAIPRHILRYELDGDEEVEDEDEDEEDADQNEKGDVSPKKKGIPPIALKEEKTTPRPRGRPRGSTSQEKGGEAKAATKSKTPKMYKKPALTEKLPVSEKVVERIISDRLTEWYMMFQEKYVLPIPCPFDGCNHDVTQCELEVHLQCHSPNLEGFRCPYEGCDFMCPHWANMRVHYRKAHDQSFQRLLCGLDDCSMIFPRIDKKAIQIHVARKHLRPELLDELMSKDFDEIKYEKYIAIVEKEDSDGTKQGDELTEGDDEGAGSSLQEHDNAVQYIEQLGSMQQVDESDFGLKKVKKRGRPPGSTKAAKLARIAAGEIIEKKEGKKEKKTKRSFQRLINNVSFFCDVCGGKYKSEQAVFDHKTLHYRDENCNILRCTECTEYGTEESSELRQHVAECHKSLLHVHRCEQCHFSTNRYHDLKKHMAVHSGSKDYMCDKCGTCTTTAYNLRVHWRRYHAPEEEKTIKCFACDYVCADNGILKEHIRSKHSMMVYGKDFKKAHPLPTFACPQCDYVGRKKSSLTYHMRIHTENRQFKCHICPYASKTKNNLLLHIRTHEGLQPLKCPECDFRGATNKIISEHVMCKHARVRPYTCKICGWTSSYHGNMWKHVETHRRELGDQMPEEPVSVVSTEGHMVAAPLKAPTLKKRGGGGSTPSSGKTPKMRGKRNSRPRFEEMEVTVEAQVQDDPNQEGVVIQLPVSTVLDGQTITLAEGISEEAAMGASALSRLSQGGEITVREVHFLQSGDNQQQHHEMITYNVPPVAVTQQIIAGGDMGQVISEQHYQQQQQMHEHHHHQVQEHDGGEHHYVQTVQVVTSGHQDNGVPRAVTEQVVHAMPHHQDHQQDHHVDQTNDQPVVHQLIPMTLPHEAELVMSMMQAHQASISQGQ